VTLRVCVIGLGAIGNLHADIHKADPLAELAGVCDIDKTRADAAAARLGRLLEGLWEGTRRPEAERE